MSETSKLLEMPVEGLAIISEFASPKRLDDVLKKYNGAQISHFLSQLRIAKILVEYPPSSRRRRGSAELLRNFVEPISDAIYRIGTDIKVLSPSGFKLFEHECDLSVAESLGQLSTLVSGLERSLQRINRKSRTVCGRGAEIRLNIGARDTCIPGWINVDVFPAEVACNISRGLPFDDGSVRYVFMAHVLEHFFYPDEALGVLRDIKRVLRKDGILRIVVPDIRKYIAAYFRKDQVFFTRKFGQGGTALQHLITYAGANSAPAYLSRSHKFGYDFDTLKNALVTAGFSTVVRSRFMSSAVPALRVDSASRSADKRLSIFVDAW
ncbi:methyltransferase domain-containing protein [Bradyrhizobium sp. F1.13.3]|uniref:class I SAM-dependent methyltransferase n=1 Tax=Bradyrhizobium sp. F1.13.3 TaxID=3156351 RepID=UPI003395E35F